MAKTDEKATLELIINGKQAQTSIKDVTVTMIGLERQLRTMKKADDPAGFAKLTKELNATRQMHSQMMAELKGGEGSLLKFKLSWKDIAAGFVSGNIAMMAIEKVIGGIPALVGKAGELSDSLADVSKQTGITGTELEGLNEDLNSIDTRTPVDQLRGLAAVAGKLGYDSRKDVLAFVKAADMINVALGEDLGGNIEEVVNNIGKLVKIFGLEEAYGIEKAMLMVASGINTIGASSSANEGYLVDWAKKFAGIAPNAGISIADTLGMAATMDILGQSVEISATNIGKMLIALGKDIPYFAKVAKMSVKEFSDLLKTDGNEAFIKVLEGAKSSTQGVEGLAKMLTTLGIEGSEGAAVIGALTKNTQLLREQQDIANKSVSQGTSVQKEFNIKNQNSGAILEKLGKITTGYWERMASGMDPLILKFGKMFGVLSELDIQMVGLSLQQDKVGKSEAKIAPLLARYVELQKIVKRSTEEQAEMQKMIALIAKEVPTSVTAWDEYGKAIDINKDKVTAFIAQEKGLLEAMRQTRREMLRKADTTLEDKISDLEKRRDEGGIRQGGARTLVKFTNAELQDIENKLAKVKAELKINRQDLAGLEGIGDAASRRLGRGYKPAPAKKSDGNDGPALSKDAEKEAQKAAEKALADKERLDEQLLKKQQELTLNMMAEQEKEMQAAHNKYEEFRKDANNNTAQLKKINELEVQELGQINDKYNAKYLKDFDKTIRKQLDILNGKSKEENQYAKDRDDDVAKRADKELFEITSHWDKEIAIAKSKGESIIELEKNKQLELDKLKAERLTKRTNDEIGGLNNSYLSDLALADEAGTSKEKIIEEHLERLRLLREKYGDLDVEQQKKVNSAIAKGERDLLAVKLDNINKTGQALQSGGQIISNILDIAASNQSEYAEFQKALALFQIAVEAGTAVAAAVAAGTKGDPYTVALRIVTAIAAVTAGIVKARALVKEAKEPTTPSFRKDGGPTDMASIMQDHSGNPEGWVSRPTLFNLGRRSYVAGEGYKKEYVISNAMLQNPAVADFAGTLEALRQQRYFANGGSTAMSQAATPATMMDPRISEMVKLLSVIANKPGGWNYSVLEDYHNLIKDTRDRASA
ncbi:MAG: phage tail tape measure protein [Chitinophagaceae bacterium]|nr:phage tail tape measure protein [Chitinophagaceae bacterium]